MTVLLLLGLTAPAFPAEAPKAPAARANEHTITVIPYYSPEKLWARFSPFVDFLKKTTGHPWELKLYHNHDAVLQALCGGDVSLALLGPVPLGRAMESCNASVLAVALGRDGKPFYRSVVLTADPAVTSLASLRGRRFGLFKGSTAAHIFPLKMLSDAGVAEKDLQTVFYESQDRILEALLGREIAGAGVKESLFRKFAPEQLRMLKASEPLPGFAVAAGPKVPDAVKKRFADAVMTLRPLEDKVAQARTRDWDDEIKFGFILPPADFAASVRRVRTVTSEFLHADR